MSQHNGLIDAELWSQPSEGQTLSVPILVVGGSTAAYAATLGALQSGEQVCWVLPRTVLGGQFTAQALSASDDAPVMAPKSLIPADQRDPNRLDNGEFFGLSRSQKGARDRMRSLQPVTDEILYNPGGGWVSHFAVTPLTAAIALNEQLVPYLEQGQLTLIGNAEPTAVLQSETPGKYRRVTGVNFQQPRTGLAFTVTGAVVIEATDLGDLLALGNIESRVGQEARSETGEAILPETAYPDCQQSFTYCVVVENRRIRDSEGIQPPPDYGTAPWLQPQEFTGTFWVNGEGRPFFSGSGMFRYRRLARSGNDSQVRPGDVTVLNWGTSPLAANGPLGCGNDYKFGALTGVTFAERQQHLTRARDRAQAYLYFLQTHDGPSLSGRGDLTWTSDGIALDPYIREARRGIALTTVCHEHVAAAFFPEASRGHTFADSVGIGHYHYLDFHPNDAAGHVDLGTSSNHRCLPFTLPLGALVPLRTEGLILSAKSIGTTHITNAAYRMHPVEWAIGEAGGHLAAFALKQGVPVREVAQDNRLTRQLQGQLARWGIPLVWFDDLSHDDVDYEAIQVLAAAGIVRTENHRNLNFNPEGAVSRGVAAVALVNLLSLELVVPTAPAFIDVPPTHFAYRSIETLRAQNIVSGVGGQRFAPQQAITREQMAICVGRAAPDHLTAAFVDTPMDRQGLQRRELSRILYRLLLQRQLT